MKKWLMEHFLPMWAKRTVFADCRRLVRENRQLDDRIRELEAYIRGLERGMRSAGKTGNGSARQRTGESSADKLPVTNYE